LILYSDLGHEESKVPCSTGVHVYHGTRGRQAAIPSELISNMAGQVFSPMYLEREVRQLKSRTTRLEVIASIVGTILLAGATYLLRTDILKPAQQPTTVNNYVTPGPAQVSPGDKKAAPQKQ